MKERDHAGSAHWRRVRRRLSYANVMATIAVFGVLAGGGAYAAQKIGPKGIAKNAVRAKHIKANQVKAKHVARNAVSNATIRDGAVTGAKVVESSLGRVPSATTAANGAAGYAQFNPDGTVKPGALNMDDLTVSNDTDRILCEDQDFAAVVATGGVIDGGGGTRPVDAISDEQLAAVGSDMNGLGCPTGTHWAYVIDNHPGGGSTLTHFTVVAFGP